MDITTQIQMLLCKARHPSRNAASRLEIRAEIQRLQNLRSAQEAARVQTTNQDPNT